MPQILPLLQGFQEAPRVHVPFLGTGAAAIALDAAGLNLGRLSEGSPWVGGVLGAMHSCPTLFEALAERAARGYESLDMQGQRDLFFRERTALSRMGLRDTEWAARVFCLWRMSHSRIIRLNRRGEWNAPPRASPKYGKVERVYCREGLGAFSAWIGGQAFEVEDFEATLEGAEEGDAVYLDPPYEETACGYMGRDSRGREITERVVRACWGLSERGVLWAMSNSLARDWSATFPRAEIFEISRTHSGFGKSGAAKEALIIGA